MTRTTVPLISSSLDFFILYFLLIGFLLLAFPGEPLTDRNVVQFVSRPGDRNGEDVHGNVDGNVLRERRVRMGLHPRHLHIGKREVHDVHGKRQFTQKTAKPIAAARAGTHRDDQREKGKNDRGLVRPVHPRRGNRREVGHRQHRCDDDRAEQKTAVPDRDGSVQPRKQKPGKERIEQPRRADQKLVGRKRPPSDDRIGGVITRGKDSEHVDVEAEQHGQDAACRHERPEQERRKTADDQGVQDVGEVFPLKRPGGSVERVRLFPPANVHGLAQRDHREAKEHDRQHLPRRRRGDHREHALLLRRPDVIPKVKQQRAECRPENEQRVEPDKTPLEERPRRSFPSPSGRHRRNR